VALHNFLVFKIDLLLPQSSRLTKPESETTQTKKLQ